MLNYLNLEWKATYTFEENPDPLSVITFEAFEGSNRLTMVNLLSQVFRCASLIFHE